MDQHYPPKSYKLFMLWMAGFFLFFIISSLFAEHFLTQIDHSLLIKLFLLLVFFSLLSLFYLIYRTESIYWINGTSYEAAKSASAEARRRFALAHLRIFLRAAVLYGLYCLIGFLLHLPTGLDIGAFLVLVIAAAVKTIPIRL